MNKSLERASNRETNIFSMKYDPPINQATVNLRRLEKRITDNNKSESMKVLKQWNSKCDVLRNQKNKLE